MSKSSDAGRSVVEFDPRHPVLVLPAGPAAAQEPPQDTEEAA
jgi:hypothetical protein